MPSGGSGRQPCRAAGFLLTLLIAVFTTSAEAQVPARPLMGYHETWSELPARDGAGTLLARLPGYANVVALSFAKPDLSYGGALELSGTGLQFPFSGTVAAEAIRQLKQRHPGTKVLISVGGATYGNWRGLNPEGIARLVRDLGADGVDIDFEPENPGCRTQANGQRACATDRQWRGIVRSLRAVLPRPMILSVAVWSVAAYGEGEFTAAPPQGSAYTGHALGLLRSAEGRDLDLVAIMGYNAAGLDVVQSFRAFRAAWAGPLALGMLVPPDDFGGEAYSLDRVEKIAPAIAADPLGGFMLYTLQRPAQGGTATRRTPDATMMMQSLCRSLHLPDCSAVLP